MTLAHPPSQAIHHKQADPTLLDIGALLRCYLGQVTALFADHLGISLMQARQAVLLAIDGLVLALINHEPPAMPYGNLDPTLAKPLGLKSFKSINALTVAHDFFGRHETAIATKISQATCISHVQALSLMGMVASLGVHLVQRIRLSTGSDDRGSNALSDSEYRLWLDLQTVFFSDAQAHDAKVLGIRTPLPLPTHSNYQSKLGKTALRFAGDMPNIPNFGWLIALTDHIADHRRPLRLGARTELPAIVSRAPSHRQLDNTLKHRLSALDRIAPLKAWFVAAVATFIFVIIGILWHTLLSTDTKPNAQQTPQALPQDVAIVRVDDQSDSSGDDREYHTTQKDTGGNNSKDDKKQPNKQSDDKGTPKAKPSNAQSSKSQASKSQPTKQQTSKSQASKQQASKSQTSKSQSPKSETTKHN